MFLIKFLDMKHPFVDILKKSNNEFLKLSYKVHNNTAILNIVAQKNERYSLNI